MADKNTVDSVDRRPQHFVQVSNVLMNDETLKAGDKAVYAAICYHAKYKSRVGYPSKERIMRKAGVSEKTVRKNIENLKAGGYIIVEKNWNKYGRKTDVYTVIK